MSGSGSGSTGAGAGDGDSVGGVCGGFGELEPEGVGSFGLKIGSMRYPDELAIAFTLHRRRSTCSPWLYRK